METKVEGINIVVKDQKISLEIEEARKLFLALKGIFEPVTQMHHGWLTYRPAGSVPFINCKANETNISLDPLDGTKITNVAITCSPEESTGLHRS